MTISTCKVQCIRMPPCSTWLGFAASLPDRAGQLNKKVTFDSLCVESQVGGHGEWQVNTYIIRYNHIESNIYIYILYNIYIYIHVYMYRMCLFLTLFETYWTFDHFGCTCVVHMCKTHLQKGTISHYHPWNSWNQTLHVDGKQITLW